MALSSLSLSLSGALSLELSLELSLKLSLLLMEPPRRLIMYREDFRGPGERWLLSLGI